MLSIHAGLVHPVGRSLSHQVLPATLEAVLVNVCVEHQKAEVGGKTLTHSDTKQGEGEPAPTDTSAAFISSFAGICGSASGPSTSCPSQHQSNNQHLFQCFQKTSVLVNV